MSRDGVGLICDRVGTWVVRLAGVVLVATALGVLVAPLTARNHYQPVLAGVLVVLCVPVLLWWCRPGRRRRPGLAVHPRRTALMLSLAGTVLATVVAAGSTYAFGWDALVIQQAAMTDPLVERQIAYFGLYPNNIPMLGVSRVVSQAGASVGLNYEHSFLAVNAVCLLIILMCTYLMTSWVAGHRAGVLAGAVTFVLLGLSPWLVVAYTDTFCIAFLTAAIALYVGAWHVTSPRRRLMMRVVGSMLLGVSLVFKPTPAVVLVAIAVIGGLGLGRAVLRHGRRSRPRAAPGRVRLAVGALCLVACLGSYAVANSAATAASGITASSLEPFHAAPPISYVAGGLQRQESIAGPDFGGYDRRLIEIIQTGTPQQAQAYSWQVISEQLSARGVLGTLQFEWSKQRWTWGDGTFWAFGEGSDAVAPITANVPWSTWAVAWNNARGQWWPVHVHLAHVLWFSTVLLAGAGLLVRRYRPDVAFLGLSTLGIAAFVLLFQGRSRYLLPLVPTVIALGCIGADRVRHAWPHRPAQGQSTAQPQSASR